MKDALTRYPGNNHPEGIKGAEAITAFRERTDFEDVIRTAVSKPHNIIHMKAKTGRALPHVLFHYLFTPYTVVSSLFSQGYRSRFRAFLPS